MSSAHWLLPSLATDLKQKSVHTVHSPAHSIARLSNLTPAVFCYLFSEAGLLDQYHGSVSLPSPGT